MAEYIVGITEGLTPETIDFLPDLTMGDLQDALSQINVVGAVDVMILGKRVTSGKKGRDVGGFVQHFEDSEEIFIYLKGEYDPDSVDDSLNIFADIFGLGEEPEKIVGFVIRPLEE